MSAAHLRRATTRGLLSVLAASTLLLAGCSQTVSGTATADPNGSVAATSASGAITTPGSSSASSGSSAQQSSGSTGGSGSSAESPTESSSAGSSSSSEVPTSGGPSTSDESTPSDATDPSSPTVDPEATLDADTLAWFQTFCGGVTDAQQYESPDTAGQTLEEAQTTIADAYTNIASSAQVTADILQGSPPPTFEGGPDFAKIGQDRFLTLADVYGRGAGTIAALPAPTETDLRDTIDAIEGEAKAAQDAAPGFPPIPADLEPAARAVPECIGVF